MIHLALCPRVVSFRFGPESKFPRVSGSRPLGKQQSRLFGAWLVFGLYQSLLRTSMFVHSFRLAT